MESIEIIVQAAAEGGIWTLYGRGSHGGWRYHADLDDHTVTPVLAKPVHRTSEEVSSWDDALGMFDRQPWFRFSPVRVHPAFREMVWQAFTDRLRRYGSSEAAEAQWREACGLSGS